MNEIRNLRNDEDAVMSKLKAIVARHGLPPYMAGAAFELDQEDGEPTITIRYQLVGPEPQSDEGWAKRGAEIVDLHLGLSKDIQQTTGRIVYYRIDRVD